jgi:hypothetical protein
MHEILLQQYEYRENEKKNKRKKRIRQEHQVKLHLADKNVKRLTLNNL